MVLDDLSNGIEEILMKGGIFILVQALVYFILSNSSDIFSTHVRSSNLKSARSATARRVLAAISDLPLIGEPSPPVRVSEDGQRC